jgi:hypothetical protein
VYSLREGRAGPKLRCTQDITACLARKRFRSRSEIEEHPMRTLVVGALLRRVSRPRDAGFTAYSGLKLIDKPVAGETVVVAAASGPVGSLVGQLAKPPEPARLELPVAI